MYGVAVDVGYAGPGTPPSEKILAIPSNILNNILMRDYCSSRIGFGEAKEKEEYEEYDETHHSGCSRFHGHHHLGICLGGLSGPGCLLLLPTSKQLEWRPTSGRICGDYQNIYLLETGHYRLRALAVLRELKYDYRLAEKVPLRVRKFL